MLLRKFPCNVRVMWTCAVNQIRHSYNQTAVFHPSTEGRQNLPLLPPIIMLFEIEQTEPTQLKSDSADEQCFT